MSICARANNGLRSADDSNRKTQSRRWCNFFRGNSGLNYFNATGTAKDLAEQIKGHCWKRSAPSFSVAHLCPDDRRNPTAQSGWNPSMFVQARELLGDEFEIVTIQELAELAIQAIKEGRCPDCSKPGYSEWDDVRENK